MVWARIQGEIRSRRIWGDRLRHLTLPAALALLVLSSPALSSAVWAATQFTLTLDPVAYDNSMRDIVLGSGRVDATLDGNRLTLSGTFTGLSSPATKAQLGIGLDFGVPATEFFTSLTPTGATAGTISGSLTLTPAQLAAVNKKQLFLRLDSVRGTEGSLWGWFEPVAAGKGHK
jgi:hypothetical protein